MAQQFWECCVGLHVAIKKFDRFQTLRNNSQQQAATCNNMEQGVQTDGTSNIQ